MISRLVSIDQKAVQILAGADTNTQLKVEKLEIKVEGDTSHTKIEMGFAHGLLYAFNSLYVMVIHNPDPVMNKNSGLYRLQDTDNDDQYDKITLLKNLVTPGGEHGPYSTGSRYAAMNSGRIRRTFFDLDDSKCGLVE